jgi:hypothetical protein
VTLRESGRVRKAGASNVGCWENSIARIADHGGRPIEYRVAAKRSYDFRSARHSIIISSNPSNRGGMSFREPHAQHQSAA